MIALDAMGGDLGLAPIVEGAVVDRQALALVKTPLIAKAMGVKWKALSPEEQAAYKANADASRYEAEKNLAEIVEGAIVDRKASLNLVKSQKVLKVSPEEQSAYNVDRKALGTKWKALSPEERAASKVDASRAEAQKKLAEMACSVFKTA